MGTDFIVKGSKELLLVAERMALDKGIPVSSVIGALEEGIRLAARKKYGYDLNIECNIDKKTGAINLFNKLEVIADADEKKEEFNYKTQIGLANAVKYVTSGKAVLQDEVEIGGFIRVNLPPIDLSRVMVQIAKTEIIKKVKEAEKEREYNEFKNRVGTIVNGVIKKKGLKNIVVDVDGYETLLHNENLIPGEQFKTGDRIRAYIVEVSNERNDCQVLLSRVHVNFLAELLKQEVAEIYDGLIEIKGIARDPGSKAKVLVYSRDNISDIIGVCVGPRGSRIQLITNELRGEKIDIIKWSENLPELVANVLTPAKVSKVVIDEITNSIDAVVPQNQLSLAIGRNGQNIRLAVKLIKHRLNILTEEEEQEKRSIEFNTATKLFVEELDVEEVIGQLLASDGYLTIESLADSNIEDLIKIEGFDEDIATEIQLRAREWVEENSPKTEAVNEDELVLDE